jgi:hypothetical protein
MENAIFPYDHDNLNSHFGRSRQIGILGNLLDFFKHVSTPNKFSSNSIAVWLPGIVIQILLGI